MDIFLFDKNMGLIISASVFIEVYIDATQYNYYLDQISDLF